MRAALLLAIFGTLAVIAAWFIARAIVQHRAEQRRRQDTAAEEELQEIVKRDPRKRR